MSGAEENKERTEVVMDDGGKGMPSPQQEEESVKSKYGGLMPKKQPLISKDHERAYFDSADWALGKQGGQKPKGPLEALRPKLQATASLLVGHRKGKMETLPKRKMRLTTDENLISILGKSTNIACVVDIEVSPE